MLPRELTWADLRAVRWTVVRELTTVLLVVLVFVLLPTLTACKNFPEPRTERDPGTVLGVRVLSDDTVSVRVERSSDGTIYYVTGLAGTPCRVGDAWPECH